MKRGSFLATTVATGLMVAGLMTVGRAGLKSQSFLFLAGQIKIAAGDTDSGMKLLAKAASGPELNTTSMLASEKPTVMETVSEKKPCPKVNVAPAVRKEKPAPWKANVKYAPEPTLASLNLPPLPMVHPEAVMFQGDPNTYLSRQQVEAVRAQQHEYKKAARIREANTRRLLHEISMKYGTPGGVPDAEQIQIQVQKELGSLVQ